MLSILGISVAGRTLLSWPETGKTYGEGEGLGAGVRMGSSVCNKLTSRIHILL